MRKKMMVIMCSLLFALPALSFASRENKGPDPSVSAYEHANENAKFKRNQNLFNKKAYKKMRAEKRAQKEAAKAEAKKKAEEAQDKGEGQVKLKF